MNINVDRFILENYTPYDGDSSFLKEIRMDGNELFGQMAEFDIQSNPNENNYNM